MPDATRPDLLCLSHLRWAFVFQRPQHLLTRAARHFRVLYWEEPEWAAGVEPTLRARTTPEGVTVVTPVLPHGADTDATQRALIDPWLARQGVTDPVLWLYTPHALDWAGHLQGRPLVYDCMDELANFRFADPHLPAKEAALLRRADLVFTGGRSLWNAKRKTRPDARLFQSGVDTEHFRPARSALPDPADQRGIPHPRLGFYGVLDERLDLELLADLARARPDWHVVLVGPLAKIQRSDLPQAPNVHWLGPKQYSELPAYLANWDVALMPFALNEATRYISPTKTPEYLAGGCPVVSTPVADVVAGYGDLPGAVRVANGPEAFVAACEQALATPRLTWLDAADRFLQTQSWDAAWAAMEELVVMKRGG